MEWLGRTFRTFKLKILNFLGATALNQESRKEDKTHLK